MICYVEDTISGKDGASLHVMMSRVYLPDAFGRYKVLDWTNTVHAFPSS